MSSRPKLRHQSTVMKLCNEVLKESTRRLVERNKRTLYIQFHEDSEIHCYDDIKRLIPNALSYRVPTYCNRSKFFKFIYAEFKSEEEAYEIMKNLKSDDNLSSVILKIDGMPKDVKCDLLVNPFKLHVTGIPREIANDKLQESFSNASVYRNDKSKFRNNANFRTVAYLHYKTIEEAKHVFEASKNLSILNQPVMVLYASIEHLKKMNLKRKNKAKIQDDDFMKWDIIFGMDYFNMMELEERAPRNYTAKLYPFGAFDPQKKLEIRDPYCDIGLEGFEACYRQCVRCTIGFLEQYYVDKNI